MNSITTRNTINPPSFHAPSYIIHNPSFQPCTVDLAPDHNRHLNLSRGSTLLLTFHSLKSLNVPGRTTRTQGMPIFPIRLSFR